MIFRPDRGERGPDPYLDAKTTLFAVAAVIAIAGMLTGRDWLVWISIALLALALLLRFVK